MNTQCTPAQLEFPGVGRRRIVGRFDGGTISSDGGALLLKDVEARAGLLGQAARCFIDHRDPERIEHSVEELVSQRVVGLALGYEDLNDHDELRHDPLLAAVVGKSDPTGQDRVRERDRGKALAGKNTLNRLELTPADATARSRYKKIVADAPALDRLFVAHFLGAYARAPRRIVLDVDATDDPLHGHQEGRFFHGYYRHYCYLPLNGYALTPVSIDGMLAGWSLKNTPYRASIILGLSRSSTSGSLVRRTVKVISETYVGRMASSVLTVERAASRG